MEPPARRFPRGPLLADGSFAQVFGTVDLRTRAACALKRFRGGNPREGLLHHAFAELIAAAEVRQPPAAAAAAIAVRVAQPLHTFCHKGGVHVVLPLASCDLDTVLEAAASDGGSRVPLACAGEIVRSLLQALCALHDAGLLHHDVKPGNVLLSVGGPPPQAAAAGGTAEGHAAAAPPSPDPAPAASAEVTLTDLGLACRRAHERPVDADVEASAAALVAAAAAVAAVAAAATAGGGGGGGTGGSDAIGGNAVGAADGEDDDDWPGDPWDDSRRIGRWQGGSRHQVGTVAWRPPELLFGARRHDSEVDAWSAGVVAVELLRAALGGDAPPPPPPVCGEGEREREGEGGAVAGAHRTHSGPHAAAAAAAAVSHHHHRLFPNGSEIECLCAQADMLGQPAVAVWPALAAGNCADMPGFMEMQPTCAHCCGDEGDGGGEGGGGGGKEAAAAAAREQQQHRQRQRRQQAADLAVLRRAAAAVGAAGSGLLRLLQRELCSSSSDGGGSDSSSSDGGGGSGSTGRRAGQGRDGCDSEQRHDDTEPNHAAGEGARRSPPAPAAATATTTTTTTSSSSPSSPRPLHHAHGVAQLAAWTGLTRWLLPRCPPPPPATAAGACAAVVAEAGAAVTGAGAAVAGAGAAAAAGGGGAHRDDDGGGGGDVALAVRLFELALRLLPLDPSRRLPVDAALAWWGQQQHPRPPSAGAGAGSGEPPAAALARVVAHAVAYRRRQQLRVRAQQ